MANIGRNDPCSCGSGRKYKHCCLALVDAERVTRVRLRQAEARVVPVLLEFALDRWGKELLGQAWNEFVFEAEELPEDLAGDPDFYPIFVPWFVFSFVPDPNAEDPVPNAPERPIAAVYLSDGATNDDFDRQLIQSASSGGFSFHVVERADVGSLTLKDILTGSRVRVLEDVGSTNVEPGSLLFALPVTTDGGSILVGCSTLVIPPTWHNQVIDFREEIWPGRRPTAADLLEYDIEIRDFYFDIVEALLDPQPPTLTNTDGELIRPTVLTFDLTGSVQETVDALQDLGTVHGERSPERVTLQWQVADGPLLGLLTIEPGRLTGDVNSAERAERLREEVASRLGDRAVYGGSQETPVEDLLDDTLDESTDEVSDGDASSPELQAIEAEITATHWDEWLDEQVPALANETPRVAATTALGRERLEALFTEFEWHNAHQPPHVRVNIAALRERLGM